MFLRKDNSDSAKVYEI